MKAIGVTVLKIQTAKNLRELQEPVIVYSHKTPIAALVPYAWYQRAQAAIEAAEDERHG